MKTHALRFAVAAALAAPMIASADATLYGKINESIDYFDIKDGFNGWTLNGNNAEGSGRASRFGFKGSEDLGGGLKAIYQLEFGIGITSGTTISQRNQWVGMAGDWGQFRVGRHDTPMKMSTGKLDQFGDTIGDYNGTIGFNDVRAARAIAYISPKISGFSFAGAVVPGAATGPQGDVNDSLASAYSVAGIYSNGPWYASAAYESFNSDNYVADSGDYDKWRIGLGILDLNGFTVAGVYENQSDVNGVKGDDNGLWQLQAGYSFGNNKIKGMYGQKDRDSNVSKKDLNSWAIGFDHSFSKRTSVYAIYADVHEDEATAANPSWNAFSLGLIHKF